MSLCGLNCRIRYYKHAICFPSTCSYAIPILLSHPFSKRRLRPQEAAHNPALAHPQAADPQQWRLHSSVVLHRKDPVAAQPDPDEVVSLARPARRKKVQRWWDWRVQVCDLQCVASHPPRRMQEQYLLRKACLRSSVLVPCGRGSLEVGRCRSRSVYRAAVVGLSFVAVPCVSSGMCRRAHAHEARNR